MINYYDVLGIRLNSTDSQIKNGYKNKLLTNHPDKSSNTNIQINLIQQAYKVLINPQTRLEYDNQFGEQLKLQGTNLNGDGLDIYNLSEFDNEGDLFIKSCPRCGSAKGIQLTEDDLINGANNGEHEFEIAVQCHDCSLWITVQYEEDSPE